MAGAKAIKAGEAYVETYAKNDKLKKDLTKATNEVAKFGAKAGKLGGAQIAGAVGGPVGVIIGGLGAALKLGLDEWILPARTFAREMERTSILSAEALKVTESRISSVREALAGMSEQAATPDGVKQLNTMIAETQKELGGLEKSLKSVQKQYESYNSALTSKENISLYFSAPLTGGLAGEQEKLKPVLDEANKKYKAQLDLLTALQRQKTELDDPTKSMKAIQTIQNFTRDLREQLDITLEINKGTAEQIKLRKLAEQFGFKPGTAAYDAAAKTVKELNTAQANKSLKEFAESLDTQRRALEDVDYDANRESLDKLMKDHPGADDAAVKRAREAIRDLNAAEATDAAQEWGRDRDELLQKLNKITKLGTDFPVAAWGSFSGISGNLQSPENSMRTSLVGLLDGQTDTNRLLSDIVDELRDPNRLTL